MAGISIVLGSSLIATQTYNFSVSIDWPSYTGDSRRIIWYLNFWDSGGNVVAHYGSTEELSGTPSSVTLGNITVPSNASTGYGSTMLEIEDPWGGLDIYSDDKDFTVTYPDPEITVQPVLSLSSQSGASVSMTWTAAQVSYSSGATIYYQYFVGPSSTYSDSYHIGTTTGLSHTMTESEIISKCGSRFGNRQGGATCYLFVRAYWSKGGRTGGWTTPTGKAFTYLPTLNPPTNVSSTKNKGKTTQISWTNSAVGNGDTAQAVLRVYRNNAWSNLATGLTSPYNVPESIWSAIGKGTYTICMAHEYYGRYANASSFIFIYAPDNTVAIYDNGSWKNCVVYVWNGSSWIQADVYNWNGTRWELCSTT